MRHHAVDKGFPASPSIHPGKRAGDDDLQILPTRSWQLSEFRESLHDLSGVEIDDQRPAGFQAGSIKGDSAVDVLRGPGDENATGRRSEQIGEIVLKIALGHARFVAAKVGSFHQQHIEILGGAAINRRVRVDFRPWILKSPEYKIRLPYTSISSMYASKAEWSIRKVLRERPDLEFGAAFHGWNACGNSFPKIAELSLMSRSVAAPE